MERKNQQFSVNLILIGQIPVHGISVVIYWQGYHTRAEFDGKKGQMN